MTLRTDRSVPPDRARSCRSRPNRPPSPRLRSRRRRSPWPRVPGPVRKSSSAAACSTSCSSSPPPSPSAASRSRSVAAPRPRPATDRQRSRLRRRLPGRQLRAGRQRRSRLRRVGGGFGGGLTVQGTVESVDGDTLTIKTANGQTIKVTTGASTTYHTQTDASASDVQAGKTVQVQLDGGFTGRPNASATTAAPVGTAGSVTVIP